MSRPYGVCTGSEVSNGCDQGVGSRGDRPVPEAPEKDRALGVQVLVQIPCRQDVAGIAHRHRGPARGGGQTAGHRPAHRHEVVAHELAAVLDIAEDHVLHVLAGEPRRTQTVAAVDPGLGHDQPDPGAQAPRRALIADDPGKPGQRLMWVREPIAVIGVGDVVGAEQIRQVARAEQPRLDRHLDRCPSRRPSASRRGSAGRGR